MSLDDSFAKLKFDARMKEWNLRHGFLSSDELNSHLKSLDDCSSNAKPLEIRVDAASDTYSNGSSAEGGFGSNFGSNRF